MLMKRMMFLLSLLLLTVGVGKAQDVPEAGKSYLMKIVSYGGTTPTSDLYIYNNNNRPNAAALPSTFSSSYVVSLVAASAVEGAFNIKMGSSYIPSWPYENNGGGFTYVSGTSGTSRDIIYKPEESDTDNHTYYLRGYIGTTEGAYLAYDASGKRLIVNSKSAKENGLVVSFKELKNASVTLNCTDTESNDKFSTTMSGYTGFAYSVSLPYYTNVSPSTVTIAENGTYDITCTPNFPFNVSTDANNMKWNAIRVRNDATHYLSSVDGKSKSRNATLTTEGFDNLAWGFVRKTGTANQFYIYNKAIGTDKPMTLASQNDMTDVTFTTSGTAFYISPQPSEFTTFTGGFVIQPNGNDGHAIGDHNSGALTYWCTRKASDGTETNDNGSIFRVVNDDALTAFKGVVAQGGGCVGALTADAQAKLNAATSLDEFYASYTDDCYVKPDVDKVYRIRFRDGQYMANAEPYTDSNGDVSTEESSRKVATSATGTDITTLYKFENKDGNYQLKSVNSGFYLGATKDSEGNAVNLATTAESQYGGTYSVDYKNSGIVGKVLLKDVNNTASTSYVSTTNSGEGQTIGGKTYYSLINTGYAVSDDSRMVIEEVTTYPVTFRAQYATLCLPFDVTIPEGVKAYVASSANEGELVLSEIDGTTIPAKTPVILEGTSGQTYNMPILGTTSTYSGTNLLSGATVERRGLEAGSYYGLSLDADNKAGFHVSNITVVAANKAYLLKSSLQGTPAQNAMALVCNFGGNVTGINAVAGSSNKVGTYYDLNGRRVLYPVHGLYMKADGQKVFIK